MPALGRGGKHECLRNLGEVLCHPSSEFSGGLMSSWLFRSPQRLEDSEEVLLKLWVDGLLLAFSREGSDLHAWNLGLPEHCVITAPCVSLAKVNSQLFFFFQFKETLSTRLLTSTLDILTDSRIREAEHHVWHWTKFLFGAHLMS